MKKAHCRQRPDRYARLLGALDDSRLRGHLRLRFADAIFR
jgi:hypothetical protein